MPPQRKALRLLRVGKNLPDSGLPVASERIAPKIRTARTLLALPNRSPKADPGMKAEEDQDQTETSQEVRAVKVLPVNQREVKVNENGTCSSALCRPVCRLR